MAAAGFLSHYLGGPLPYMQHHITVNKIVLSASLKKIFPSCFVMFQLKIHNLLRTFENYSFKMGAATA